MSFFKQTRAVTLLNLGSVPSRAGTSMVIVLGIAGVVGVLVSVLSMATGLERTVANAGSDNRAIVIRAGSGAETASSISREAVNTVLSAPGIAVNARGRPITSAEALRIVALRLKSTGTQANVALRGVGPLNSELRPELHLIEGRMFRPGVRELIVGQGAKQQFSGLEMGNRITLSNTIWTVVGTFTTGGDFHESELLTDTDTVLAAYKRNMVQAVAVKLHSARSMERFKSYLSNNSRLAVSASRESDLFRSEASSQIAVVHVLAYFVGGVMALGALFGALNTMYSAVSTRVIEIATLRAIGFGAGSVVVSILAEAFVLSLAGAALGSLCSWLLFSGKGVSALNPGTFTQLVFHLEVTPELVVTGVVWACAIGLIGGVFPALRAAHVPVATALRHQA